MAHFQYKLGTLLALALASCAAPKAIVVQEVAPALPKQELVKTPDLEPAEPEKVAALPTDDGLRTPGMLDLPSDAEFRGAGAAVSKPGSSGALIVRPPTDPPSRVKPKEDAAGAQR